MSVQPDAPPPTGHEQFQILMMGSLDGELPPEEEARFRDHLGSCPECARDLVKYRRLADLAAQARRREPQDFELDRFWNSLYGRMERRSGWVLLAGGVLLLTGALVYEIVRVPWISWWLKAGVLALAAGFLVLFLHALRARLRVLPLDPYREVRR
jgi:anti-sigma factor RsiW